MSESEKEIEGERERRDRMQLRNEEKASLGSRLRRRLCSGALGRGSLFENLGNVFQSCTEPYVRFDMSDTRPGIIRHIQVSTRMFSAPLSPPSSFLLPSSSSV